MLRPIVLKAVFYNNDRLKERKKKMLFYDRENTMTKVEQEEGAKALEFLYQSVPGRILLWVVVIRPWFSKLCSLYQKSSLSKHKIRKFAKKHQISDAGHLGQYDSFNDFFIRKREVTFNSKNKNELLSPADSKLSVYHVSENLILRIKGSKYKIDDLLHDRKLANEYRGGLCLVFRLATNDYHRYHFIDDGKIIETNKIDGVLHTVRSISEEYDVFVHNSREITVMNTVNFGKVTQIDVGALMIGKIKNRDVKEFQRGDEKGYFEFGGSTIVMLFKKDTKIQIDSDIIRAGNMKMETKVRLGEKIGEKKRRG